MEYLITLDKIRKIKVAYLCNFWHFLTTNKIKDIRYEYIKPNYFLRNTINYLWFLGWKFSLKSNPGSDKMQEISSTIQIGAQAYLNRQYTTIAIVGAVICVLLYLFLEIFGLWEVI